MTASTTATAIPELAAATPSTVYRADDLIPVAMFSKDHWSTLAYVESVMTECAGFQVGLDPRMRATRRSHPVMSEECPHPKRPSASSGRSLASTAITMRPGEGTVLKDGTKVPGHDDWACLQDLAEAGYFTTAQNDIEPGVTLHLSERGRVVAAALRTHKAGGGQFRQFVEPA